MSDEEVDADLEAEIENFLCDQSDFDDLEDEMSSDLIESMWITELKAALREPHIDCDSIRLIIAKHILPKELRLEVWQILLGVKNKSNNFDGEKCKVKNEIQLEKDTRRLGSKQHFGERIIGYYLNSKDTDYHDPDLVYIVEAVLYCNLEEYEIYNLFYAINSKYKPKCSGTTETALDLLVQYYDPLFYRFIKCRQLDMIHRSVRWIQSLFRSCLAKEVADALWDILFQCTDSLMPIWICLVFILNSRDKIMTRPTDEKVPNFESIGVSDIEDILSLTNYYRINTPKSFIKSLNTWLYGKKQNRVFQNSLEESIIMSVEAQEFVTNVLEGKQEIILDIRPSSMFEREQLIGSLRLNLVIEDGLIDPLKLSKALEKFKSIVMKDLNKDEDNIPFLILIGDEDEKSTLYTAATQLIKLGYVGVSYVKGGFQSVKKEILNAGTEELLLWTNTQVEKMEDTSGWFYSAITTINSTIDKVLTIEDSLMSNEVDDQF